MYVQFDLKTNFETTKMIINIVPNQLLSVDSNEVHIAEMYTYLVYEVRNGRDNQTAISSKVMFWYVLFFTYCEEILTINATQNATLNAWRNDDICK